MKPCFIIILYKTPVEERRRLLKEIRAIGFNDYKSYFVDNTYENKGYAAAVNIGMRNGLKDGCDLFIIINPDISFPSLKAQHFTEASKQFDIFGFSMKQNKTFYYGGQIDRWRMSGGLIIEKPKNKYAEKDFISGSFMVIKRKTIEEVGFFEEEYFMYYEDVDYCYRARKMGLKVGIDSKNHYDHFELSKTSKAKDLFLFKNRIRFLLKYGSVSQKIYEVIRVPKTLFELAYENFR